MPKEYEFDGRLMGCDLSIAIVSTAAQHAERAYAEALKMGQAAEARFSRFLPTSELSQLNSSKSLIVSPAFMAVLQTAQVLWRETGGLFNPLVQIGQFGYSKTFEAIKGVDYKTMPPAYDTEWQYIARQIASGISDRSQRIQLRKEQQLDYGGFLKGMVAEQMAREIMTEYNTSVIVNIGGDLFTLGKDAERRPFTFDIYNPVTDDFTITIPLTDGALATSGVYRRKWTVGGKEFFHILNKDGTDNPNTDLVSVTVIAREGFRADGYATTAVAMGSEAAQEFLASKEFVSYVLIDRSGQVVQG